MANPNQHSAKNSRKSAEITKKRADCFELCTQMLYLVFGVAEEMYSPAESPAAAAESNSSGQNSRG